MSDALRKAAQAIVDFHNAPITEKRPDVFQRLVQGLDCALDAQPAEQPALPSPWLPITNSDPVPRDGSYFAVCCAGNPDSIECGFIHPHKSYSFEQIGEGLFQKVEHTVYMTGRIHNMHAATHWMPIPPPPEAGE